MTKKKYRILFVIPFIVIFSGACSLLGGETNSQSQSNQTASQAVPTAAIAAQQGGGGGEQSLDTDFPLPKDVAGFMHLGTGEGAINFQTKMTIAETVEFYRTAFKEKGLSEETILTTIQDNTFSIVFKGSANGKAIVVQGVDLGNGTTNINIRYEDV